MMMNDDGDAGGDVDSLAFFPPKEVCSRAGAWATGRITRDCVFTHRCYTQKLLRTKAFTQRSLYTKLLYT